MKSGYHDPMRWFVSSVLVLSLGATPNEFARPIEQPTEALSASFGEYRGTHLHAGIDFATFGVTGLPVHAIADGRIQRVRSSRGGYGNVVYIDHASGLRSVYAHLESFAPAIRDLLPRPAHKLGGDWNGEAMEAWPKRAVLVAKGEVIAWSGESGAGKPHLHFELRDQDDHPRNPVLFGVMSVRDAVPPKILNVIVEPADVSSSIDGSGWPAEIVGSTPSVVLVNGRARILLSGYDEDGADGGRFGLTRVELHIDSRLWSAIDMRQFSYGPHREVGEVHDLFRTGFGPAEYAYDLTARNGAGEVVASKGVITAEKSLMEARIVAVDLAGNRAERAFTIVRDELPQSRSPRRDDGGKAPLPDTGEWISRGGLAIRRGSRESRIGVPAAASEWGVNYRVSTSLAPGPAAMLAAGLGKIVGAPENLRIFSATSVSLAPHPSAAGPVILIGPYGQTLPSRTSIMLIQSNNANGIAVYRHGQWAWLGGESFGEFLYAEMPCLAPVSLVRDALPPAIEIKDIPGGKGRMRITFDDDLSGIDEATIRVLRESAQGVTPIDGRYDPDHRSFEPHDALPRGKHDIRVEVGDGAGNKASARRKISVP